MCWQERKTKIGSKSGIFNFKDHISEMFELANAY